MANTPYDAWICQSCSNRTGYIGDTPKYGCRAEAVDPFLESPEGDACESFDLGRVKPLCFWTPGPGSRDLQVVTKAAWDEAAAWIDAAPMYTVIGPETPPMGWRFPSKPGEFGPLGWFDVFSMDGTIASDAVGAKAQRLGLYIRWDGACPVIGDDYGESYGVEYIARTWGREAVNSAAIWATAASGTQLVKLPDELSGPSAVHYRWYACMVWPTTK
jgi:hypothetical protein